MRSASDAEYLSLDFRGNVTVADEVSPSQVTHCNEVGRVTVATDHEKPPGRGSPFFRLDKIPENELQLSPVADAHDVELKETSD